MTRRSRRRHCPHSRLRGIHGDEINHTPRGYRLECLECGSFLDGPVMLAMLRQGEAELASSR